MKPIVGLIIIIISLLIAVYFVVDYLMPNVICKSIRESKVENDTGNYRSHILSDICSGIH